ncbi:glycoside hydrolase family 32 protein [Blastopirellula marina]|nr:glycoside hydrolase family 32 protein [Blastopirellula marina]
MNLRSFARLVGLGMVASSLHLAAVLLIAQEIARPDIVIADFEENSYGDWKPTGEAFGTQPAQGTLDGQMEVSGYEGKYLVNSFRGGDRTTGTLTSPSIKIERPFVTFLIGGGAHAGETCLNLMVDGEVVRTATGPNAAPGGSERLMRAYWDVSELIGKRVVLQVVDQHRGGWGHLNVDDIRASNRRAGIPAEEITKGPDLRTFASYEEVGYDQAYRPQFHFSSLRNWLNDPNGMVYLDGEYHLFFQHNPLANVWGNMTWGHAVSQDMVHWKQLPHAILPYKGGTIFSGTAAVDVDNTLGMQQGDVKTLVAAFTFAKSPFYQAMAYSTDRGRTFELWNEGKAIVPNQGYDAGERDPKIFWHEPSKKWAMVLWVKQAKPGRVLIFNSDDLQRWTEVSQFDRDWVFECMDLVELSVDGDPTHKKWLLYDASFEYEVGEFDGKTFTTDKKVQRGDYGPNYYAAQSFNNMPDDRCVSIGWMRGDNHPFLTEEMPFNQQMSFPTTMELKTTADGLKLIRWPVKEIEALYDDTLSIEATDLNSAAAKLQAYPAELVDLSLEFEADESTELLLYLRGEKITYREGAFHYGNTTVPAMPIDGVVSLRVLVDRASVELFANQGLAVSTHYAVLEPFNRSLGLSSSQEVKIRKLVVHRLKSAW